MTAYARLRHSGAGRRAGARLPVCPEQRNLEFLTLQGKKSTKRNKASKHTERTRTGPECGMPGRWWPEGPQRPPGIGWEKPHGGARRQIMQACKGDESQ